MDERWSVLVIGLGTVFAALLGLFLVLRLFPFFFPGAKPQLKRDSWIVTQQPVLDTGLDEGELVAIITAAISMQMNAAAGSFRVVSVMAHDNPERTPSWGSVDRGRWSPPSR